MEWRGAFFEPVVPALFCVEIEYVITLQIFIDFIIIVSCARQACLRLLGQRARYRIDSIAPVLDHVVQHGLFLLLFVVCFLLFYELGVSLQHELFWAVIPFFQHYLHFIIRGQLNESIQLVYLLRADIDAVVELCHFAFVLLEKVNDVTNLISIAPIYCSLFHILFVLSHVIRQVVFWINP